MRSHGKSHRVKVDKIYCAPGNAGIEEFAECIADPGNGV